jgi:gamma-glutamyltranspeptidase/glutathione hydrolase
MLTDVFGRMPESWLDFDPTRARPATGRAVAATAHPLASWAALTMLHAGGSAIDAAVAAQAVLTAVEPNASSLGGGALILAATGGRVHAFEGLSAAPAEVTDRLGRDFDGRIVPADRAAFGGRTVGVPGALKALALAHGRFGRLGWASLFEPAVALAEQGYPLSPYLLRTLRENPAVQTEAMAQALYCGGGGSPLAAGTPLRNPALARTLKLIATQGAEAFYQGEIARDICAAVAADPFPGRLTMADMAAYQAVERDPVRFALGGMQVMAGCLPAFGGMAVGQVVGIAAAMGLQSIGLEPSADEIHILAEAGRLAYADRAEYAGDPDVTPCDAQALLDPAYLARRAGLLDRLRRTEGLPAGTGEGESMTSHVSIADADGMVVSMTTTINNNFGARIAVGGFYLNNVMTNFATNPRQNGRISVNAMRPRRRARTSIAPCIVLDADGRPFAAIGAGGGNRIIGYVANGLLRLASGMRDPQSILSAPHALNTAGMTEMEPPLDRHAAELASRGHWVMPRRLDGGTQMILRTATGWTAGGDPRRDGAGMGLV